MDLFLPYPFDMAIHCSLFFCAMSMMSGFQNTKINYGMDTTGEKEKGTSKKNLDGRSISSRETKKFRTRSMEKPGGTAFGFRKTATAIVKPDR